jgi:hypothetical protein
MRTGPGRVIRELGVELLPGGASVVLPANYGISMSSEDLKAVQSATGVAPDALGAMLLSVYDGTVLDLSSLGHGPAGGQVSVREWAQKHESTPLRGGRHPGPYAVRAVIDVTRYVLR